MDTEQSSRNAFEELAAEFVERYRQGERPALSEYTDRCPEHAEEIRDLFPTLLVMERLKPSADEKWSEAANKGNESKPRYLGDYHIIREVGRGGMGIVYEAEQQSLGRRVALKVLPKQLLLDPKQKQRFIREARAAAHLHHTNIVPVFGVGEHEGLQYYAMQYIHGLGLDEVLAELKNLRLAGKPEENVNTDEGGVKPTRPPDPKLSNGVSAQFVANSLVTGSFEKTRIPEAPLDPDSEDEVPEDRSSNSLHSLDTACSRLSDTFSLSGSVNLPGHFAGSSRSKSAKTPFHHSVARIGIQVAEALQFAHDQGILHRDIKPSNLLLDTRGTVWVTDFGLAKHLPSPADDGGTDTPDITGSGDLVGTLRYMPPESFAGKTDARSDVYSLGLTLYELVAIQPAFSEIDRRRLIKQVSSESPERLRKLDPQAPRDLATIIEKAIERDASHRYQTAKELADDLQRYLDDEPIRARRISSLARFSRWCKRNPGIALLSAVIASLLLVLGIGGVIWAIQSESASRQVAKSEETATRRLYESFVAQAEASRWNRRPGQRLKTLDALKEASLLMPRLGLGPKEKLALRNEAIAAMGLVDIVLEQRLRSSPTDNFITIDPEAQRYAAIDASHHLCVRRLDNHQLIRQLPIIAPPYSAYPRRRFSSDGRFLIYLTAARRCCVWDFDLNKQVLEVEAKNNKLYQFSCRGESLAVIVPDGSVRIYHFPTGKLAQSLPVKAWSVALSHDGSRAAIAREDNPDVEIWDLASRRLVRKLTHAHKAGWLAWSPDDRLLACAMELDYTIDVWNSETGERCAELSGHQNAGLNLDFSQNGRVLVSAAWDDTVRLWDALSGRELLRTEGTRCEVHHNDVLLLTGSSFDRGVFRLQSSPECRTLRPINNVSATRYTDCDFLAGSPILASARRDGMRIWNSRTGQELAFAEIGKTDSILFHGASHSLISVGDTGVFQWPIATSNQSADWTVGPPRKLLKRKSGQPGEAVLAQSGDGSRLAATISAWKAAVFNPNGSGDPIIIEHRNLDSLAFSPDGQWLVSGTQFGRGIKVWNAKTGELEEVLCPESARIKACFSPDGEELLVCELAEGVLRFFDTGRWKPLRQYSLKTKQGRGLDWSSDGRLVAVCSQTQAMLVDPSSGDEVATIASSNEGGNIEALRFSLENDRLAIVYRNAIEVWDLNRVRKRLAEMNLDWDMPALNPPEGEQPAPERVQFKRAIPAKKTPITTETAIRLMKQLGTTKSSP